MTQKELLYIEDIYNHELLIIEVINKLLQDINDENYTSLLNDHLKKHTTLSNNIIKLLEGEV